MLGFYEVLMEKRASAMGDYNTVGKLLSNVGKGALAGGAVGGARALTMQRNAGESSSDFAQRRRRALLGGTLGGASLGAVYHNARGLLEDFRA
jgi:hypothetical protein